MIVQQILGGDIAWEQWPVYVGAELVAGVAAALLFGFIAHTRQDAVPATAPAAAIPAEV
jgi:glycerol uptake facilitator protein